MELSGLRGGGGGAGRGGMSVALACPLCEMGVLMLVLLLQTGLEDCLPLQGSGVGAQPWNTSCPSQCLCDLRPSGVTGDMDPGVVALEETANCTKKKLRSVPMELPINTQTLLLQGNAIRSLHEHLPPFTDLREMDLANNRITSLGPYPIFQNLTSLRHLNMEHNAVETLLHGSFSGLANLQELRLGHNQIELIEEHAFGGLNHLRALQLEGNKLSRLNERVFENLPHLETMSLADNLLQTVAAHVFSRLTSLKVLSLRGNKLKSLTSSSTEGLETLSEIDLSNNAFTRVPSDSLKNFQSLQVLTFDANPIKVLSKRSFQSVSVQELQLSNMPNLIAIDAGAFYDLQTLETLQIHDNPKLGYLDPGAFVQLNNLQMVYLHHNNLKALPYTIPLVLQGLREVSFYDNPMQCDCNMHWVKQQASSAHTNNTGFNDTISFSALEKYKCATPKDLQGKSFKTLPLAKLTSECAPTVIPFFDDSDHLELCERISYDCRAIGVPDPHIHWILPNGKILNGTSNYSRIRLENTGTLSIDHLKASDAGKYTCVATNGKGYDTTLTVLRIHNKDIHIIHKAVATNFVTVTWNGTGSTIATSDYVIMYREHGAKYHTINIRPYMRTYTISNLKPHTVYEFCTGYKHANKVQKLNCLDIQTKYQMFPMTGIRSMGNLSILIAIVITCSFICFLCVATMVIRRYRKRKSYKEPEGDNVPQKVGNLSQIPLDNIYHPPSTPLCTSRTSLIGQPSSSA